MSEKIRTDGEASHLCRAFLLGRGKPSEIVKYEVIPYMQKLFIIACQEIELEEMEKTQQ